MSSNDAYIEISTGTAYKFTNASNNDIVLYGTNAANQVLIGSTSNAYAGVSVGLSNVSLSVMGNDRIATSDSRMMETLCKIISETLKCWNITKMYLLLTN